MRELIASARPGRVWDLGADTGRYSRTVAEFFASLAPYLVIEFVPKDDSQVQRMLSTREDVLQDYDVVAFEAELSRRFEIVRSELIPGSFRRLYLMRPK